MRHALIFAAALATIATAVAASDELVGPTFVLEDINGTPVEGAGATTLVFGEDGGVSGNGGCNGYGGSVTFGDGDALKIENVISTMMACDEPVMSQEQAWFGVLETATRYHLSGGELFLLDDPGNKLATLSVGE